MSTNIMRADDLKPCLYLNTVVNEIYKDIVITGAADGGKRLVDGFNQKYIPDLTKYAVNDSFLTTELPCVYTYYSSVGYREEPLIVFSKSSRKTKAVSRCRFTQAVGWAWSDGSFIKDAFDSILDYGFYSEDEVDRLSAGTEVIGLGSGSAVRALDYNVHIDPKALRVLVYSAYRRWNRFEPLVRIAVPKSVGVDHYNDYVLAAVKEIYSYFPVALKVEAGFSSYLPAGNDKNVQRVYFAFVPEAEADIDTVYLDGSSISRYQRMPESSGIASVDRMVDYILTLDIFEERKKYLDVVFSELEAGGKIIGFSPVNYSRIGNERIILEDAGDAVELLPKWIDVYNNKNDYSKAFLEEIKRKIKEKLSREAYLEFLLKTFPTKDKLEDAEESLAYVKEFSKEVGMGSYTWEHISFLLDKEACDPSVIAEFLDRNRLLLMSFGECEYESCRTKWSQKALRQIASECIKEIRNLSGSRRERFRKGQSCIDTAESCMGKYTDIEQASMVENKLRAVLSDTIVEELERELADIERAPETKASEINTKLIRAQELLEETQGLSGERSDSIKERFEVVVSSLAEALRASKGLIFDIQERIEKCESYFETIDFLNGEGDSLKKLEQADLDEIKSSFRRCHPKPQRYTKAFKDYYSKPLTATALLDFNEFCIKLIIEDLCNSINDDSEITNFNFGKEKAYSEILRGTLRRSLLNGNSGRTFRLGRISAGAEDVLFVMSFGRYGDRILDRSKMSDIMRYLSRSGFYSKNDMVSFCLMGLKAGLDAKEVLQLLLEGQFADAEEEDYCLAFKAIAIRSQLAENKMRRLYAEAGSDQIGSPMAQQALDRYTIRPEKKDYTQIIAFALAALALVFLALSVVFCIGWKKNRDEIINQSALIADGHRVIANKDNEIDRLMNQPTTIEFFDAEFSCYSDIVKEAFADEDKSAFYSERLSKYRIEDIVTVINGNHIAWGEYFFWECYFSAISGAELSVEEISDTQLKTRIESAITLCHLNELIDSNSIDAENDMSIENENGNTPAPVVADEDEVDVYYMPAESVPEEYAELTPEEAVEAIIAVVEAHFNEAKLTLGNTEIGLYVPTVVPCEQNNQP